MPFLIVLALIAGFGYQTFFRYDTWMDPHNPAVVYERDNLTGQVQTVVPQAEHTLTSRLMGTMTKKPVRLGPIALTLVEEEPPVADNNHNQSLLINNTEGIALRPPTQIDPSGRRAIPEPYALMETRGVKRPEPATSQLKSAYDEQVKPTFAALGQKAKNKLADALANRLNSPQQDSQVQAIDLNRDGLQEKVVIKPSDDGSFNEFSIYNGDIELFYGQGQTIEVLPTQNNGWQNLKLTNRNQTTYQFKFNPRVNSYELIN